MVQPDSLFLLHDKLSLCSTGEPELNAGFLWALIEGWFPNRSRGCTRAKQEKLMSNESNKALSPSRRQVFAAGGTVGALAAAAAVLPLVKAVEPAVKATSTGAAEAGGYQVTAHVLRYYETTRV